MRTAGGGEPFAHPALFYRGDEQYTAGTVPFLAEGLAAGEAVAVAVPGPRLALIESALGADAAGVEFLDMTRAGRNPGRIIPGVLRAFADAHPAERVRIIGEPIWAGRSAAEYPACVQHEALINAAFQGREATILCPYDADGLAPEVLADAHATHPVVIDTGVERASDAYDPGHVVARYNQPLAHPPGAASLPFDAQALPGARAFAVREAGRLGIAGDRVQDLTLAVAELTTNSVVHGGGSGTLRIWAEGGQIVCEVHDRGRLTDPLAGRRPPARDQLGGRGLLLVHYVTDLVRLHTAEDGTTVRFYLPL
ncbi:sensor histidine kinase [Streptomyces griseiscabiei]|uniref:Sensor histidine kinase n=1 Tax=Streptomyces griseiscabiei TaxID=2993540 RepID=A0ABU4L1K3_9ACTN|nr:sensor histidine kinase [Streptomyces griseiscabiei]MBZ3906004.1 sensor histidine kinase [Streptomyces griseiscabiei]MDX2909635.1 sensor histidine kinase [Streptomyces griseiscabiei]